MGWTVQGLIPCRGQKFFSSPKRPYQLQDPPTLLFTGYWELFPWGMKQLEHEADH